MAWPSTTTTAFIRKELGILVPMPADEQRINQALIKAALLKNNRQRNYLQDEFDFSTDAPDLKPLQSHWQDAKEKAKANRTVFAQKRPKPGEVMPEWEKQRALLGGEADVQRFVQAALSRLNAPLEPHKKSTRRMLPQHLPAILRERLETEDITKPIALDFHYPPKPGTRFLHRTHRIVSLLAANPVGNLTPEAAARDHLEQAFAIVKELYGYYQAQYPR